MTLRLSIFTNAGTVPLDIARTHGFFQDVGLEVHIEGTTSSIQQMTGVIDGRYDIAATAIDNVIAYNSGQGAAPTTNPSNLKVFLGSASYRLPLVVAPGITGFADLADQVIAVDALDTGFAFLLREMLALNGLPPGSYSFQSVGAPKERWDAVRSGAAAAALLNAHFEAIAHGQGCRTLTSDPDPWDTYQGNAFCAGPDFLKNGPVDAFCTAVLRAVAYTKDPAHLDEVAQALTEHLVGLDQNAASAVARALQGPDSILRDGLPVTRAGIENVLRLRETYTGTSLGLTPEDLCDPRVTIAP